ncbi:MAG TPA: hypothetical protein PKZ83_17620 [bacterium]|nr:hypothetical protein [bacterium]
MDRSTESEKKILFKIDQIRKLSYFEYNFVDLGLTLEDLVNPRIDLGINIGQENEKGLFIIQFKTIYKVKDDIEFLGIESVTVFAIQNHKEVLAQDECGNYRLPQDILNKFAAIAVGATRGMLAVMTSSPIYQRFVIPPINVEKMLSEGNKLKD